MPVRIGQNFTVRNDDEEMIFLMIFFSFFWEAVIIVSGKQNSLSKTFKFTFKSAPAQSESNLKKNSSLLFQATETR